MRNKQVNKLFYFLAFLNLSIAAFLIFKVQMLQGEYRAGDKIYEQIYQIATEATDAEAPDKSLELPYYMAECDVYENEKQGFQINFDKLQDFQIVAWLYSPDTVINYPIAQGTDNEYYLTHLIDGTVNRNGCLFMDCQNSGEFSDENTIIYGHHMASGKMFASLVNYADQAYYDAHSVLYLFTENKQYRIELFSGYTTTADSSAYTLTFKDKYVFADWIGNVSKKSDFSASVKLTANDYIITLSTCAYSFPNARYVVHGKLVEIEDNFDEASLIKGKYGC